MGKISNQQKRARYYNKVKNNEEFKLKERACKKLARQRQKDNMTSAQLKHFHASEVTRVMALKKRVLISTVPAICNTSIEIQKSTYTPQSKGKALKKSYAALPKSPTKRKVIVTKLAEQHGLA